MTTNALVRAPGPELAACELTHLERTPIDVERALAQHAAYVETLEALGVRVRALPALEGHADACFVEDPAVVLDDVAIMTRPGAASRVGEVSSLENALSDEMPVVRLERGSLEGGDVLRIGDRLVVGRSTRTDDEGARELERIAGPRGLSVDVVGVPGALHLKTAVTWVGDDVLVANENWIDVAPLGAFRVVATDPDEPLGANVLRVGDRIVASAAAPRTAERIADLGFEVTLADISEFHRAEAGLTCLSLLWAPES